MSENHRKCPRQDIHVDVQLVFLDNDPRVIHTRDISECGMFLEIDDTSAYPLGEMVHLKYVDPIHDNLGTEMDAIIVRVADGGIGVAFVKLDAF
jgi:hypothetical protein